MFTQETPRTENLTFAVLVENALIGKDALLKTCYWFSRDFGHEILKFNDGRVKVILSPKTGTRPEVLTTCVQDFLNMAIDYELRSIIEAKTAATRELILAKAFSESGVLEAQPEGHFSDLVDEQKPDGLFHILSSGTFR